MDEETTLDTARRWQQFVHMDTNVKKKNSKEVRGKREKVQEE